MSVPARLFASLVVASIGLIAQPPRGGPSNDPAAELLREGRQKITEGKQDEALAIYKSAVEKFPTSVQAASQTGVLLDLMGQYAEAKKYFQKAIDVAATPQAKSQAMRSMAMSYAFEGDCKNAVKYEAPIYEQYLTTKSWFEAGETANEVARVCIDSGSLDEATNWYTKGHDAGMNEPRPEQKDLWNFRYEHALARIAARRGNKSEAQKHVEAAKRLLDKGTLGGQEQFYPYLTGYVAFYGGDYKTALAELQKANQNDAFIQVLMAQTYEKLGDKAKATEYYKKVLSFNGHNPPAAASRPLAMKKLAQLR